MCALVSVVLNSPYYVFFLCISQQQHSTNEFSFCFHFSEFAIIYIINILDCGSFHTIKVLFFKKKKNIFFAECAKGLGEAEYRSEGVVILKQLSQSQ